MPLVEPIAGTNQTKYLMEFQEYDPDLGWLLIQEICKKHKIKIHKNFWKEDRGTAWSSARLIKIPSPTNVRRFGICIHEIKHIFDGHKGEIYQKEFECEIYTINFLKDMHLPYWQYQKRAGHYVLFHLAKKWNKREFEIPMDIILFFADIDFNEWLGKKVYPRFDHKQEFGYKFIYINRK